MNRRTLDAIAVLVIELRRETGQPWDPPGVMAALQPLADHDPAPLAIAAIRAATNPTNRTPAVIGLDGPHWRDTPAHTPTPTPPRYRPEPARNVAPPERAAAWKARAIQAMNDAKTRRENGAQ